MQTQPLLRWIGGGGLVLVLIFGDSAAAPGQQLKPNPLAPILNPVMPLGMPRGTKLEITLTGKNLAGPTAVLTTFPATIAIPTDNKNGTEEDKLRVQLEVPADAPIGAYSLRLATTRGMSNLRLFCVDELPQVVEKNGHHEAKTALEVPVPCVVAGTVDNQKSDYFKMRVQAGQRVSFDLLSRRLGLVLDPLLTIYSVATGREIIHANDSPGLQTDARLTHTFTEAGEYLIEIRDVLYRGGSEYGYRLRIGDFPCATTPIPLMAKRGSKLAVRFAGTHAAEAAPVEVQVPAEPAATVVWVAPRGKGGLAGWPVSLAISDRDEGLEQEPNDEPAQANKLAVSAAVTGRLEKYGDTDHYSFAAKKGQVLNVQVDTLELHSPTLVYLRVKDGKGNELTRSNPAADPPADQRVDFNPPADGVYLIEIQHLNYVGGPEQAYRLTIEPKEPAFALSLDLDRWDMAAGEAQILPLQIQRVNFTGPIHVRVLSAHPGLSGQAVLTDAKTGHVIVQAKADMPPGAYPLLLLASAEISTRPLTELVSVRGPVSDSLADLPYPPLPQTNQIAIAVLPKPPFQLAAQLPAGELVPGINTEVILTVQRNPGFDEAITPLPPEGLPAKVAASKPAPIAKGQNTGKLALTVPADTPLGTTPVSFRGQAKVMGKTVNSSAAPLLLVVTRPVALKVEPATIQLKQGEKVKLKITAERKGGYKGPINLELRNLPDKVAAGKAALAENQTSAEIEIQAQPDAPPATRANVEALATATAAGNQQQASPPFRVTVEKK